AHASGGAERAARYCREMGEPSQRRHQGDCGTGVGPIGHRLSSPLRGERARYPAHAFAKADARRAIGFAPGAKSHFVAVFEEAADFTVREGERLLAAAADFEERAEAAVAVGRKRAGTNQVAGLQVAAV